MRRFALGRFPGDNPRTLAEWLRLENGLRIPQKNTFEKLWITKHALQLSLELDRRNACKLLFARFAK